MAQRLAFVALLVVAAFVGRSLRLNAHGEYTEQRAYEDVYYLPPPQWLPVLSLGYRDALADLLWARTLVYFGEELSHKGAVRHVYNYADAMLALDDHFRAAYRWVATASLYRPTDISPQDARRAVSYLERAVDIWPDDGELAWDLGATLRFELAPLLRDDKEAANEVKLRGTEYIQTAARLGAGPQWLAVTAATGLEEAGRTEQAIRHLQEIYPTVTDPDAKARIEKRLSRLQSESYVRNLRRAVESFERERLADYPYMDPGLYLVMGPRPERAWAAALARGFSGEPVADFPESDRDDEPAGELEENDLRSPAGNDVEP